jgi:hypothetical protein
MVSSLCSLGPWRSCRRMALMLLVVCSGVGASLLDILRALAAVRRHTTRKDLQVSGALVSRC